jgi:hypothetical protein
MSETSELAARLRQAIQGCVVHNHGPIQAWAAIVQAQREGLVSAEEVARLAIESCQARIADLKSTGAIPEDTRIQKEELTLSFIKNLFLGQRVANG